MKKIGIFSKKEEFSKAVLQRINGSNSEVKAVFGLAGETRLFDKPEYDVMIDRISRHVHYFREYFKNSALMGSYVINNPLIDYIHDRFLMYDRIKKLGVKIPRTVAIPTREQDPACSNADLENLKYPLDWEFLGDFVGFPAILKPYYEFGFSYLYKVDSVEELLDAYNGTGRQLMILQEFIDFDYTVKIYVAGQDVLITRYYPSTREYIAEEELHDGFAGDEIAQNALSLSKQMGFDFNSIEFGVKDDVPYTINFFNPIPDCRPEELSEKYFKWMVEKVAGLTVEIATKGGKNSIKQLMP